MYKSESMLGLIASILAAASAALILIFALLLRVLLRLTTITGSRLFSFFGPALRAGGEILGAGAIIAVLASTAIIGASVVLGFVGTSLLKKGVRNGGVMLVIAGALMLVPPYLEAGVFDTAVAVLFFIGGIMALTKKAAVA